ncbi:DISARM system helicase DrmA [Rhodococcus sp. JG-3]|uniref:DISARM system helicase DrmA n=1 Tax=Rhodococcus sp. JG-3 TaxID=1305835 RepID=UPI00041E9139|nr:DISARM system helicase DrmA [Rhodococcus sp. JG-3]
MSTNDATAGPTSSYDVRAELEQLLERDLLGPRDGDEEELPPGVPPAERYLIGRLVPRTRPSEPAPVVISTDEDAASDGPAVDADPDLVDNEVTDATGSPGDDVPVTQSARTGTMAASAIGLSFQVPLDVEKIVVTASWGSYAPTASEVHVTAQGKPRRVWRRTPRGGTVEVDLTLAEQMPTPIDSDQERVVLRVTVRDRGAVRLVDLALVNDQGIPDSSPDTARIYQVGLVVTALDGAAPVFLAHNDPDASEPPAKQEAERLHLALLYRGRREYSHGRQCAVDPDVRDGEVRAWRLSTTSFPAADVALTVPGDPASMPGLVTDMARLGSPELARDDLERALRPLATGYRRWLADQRERLDDSEIRRYRPAGAIALDTADTMADRLDRAITLLRDDPHAREAFRFANQAMALQRVRSEMVRERTADPTATVSELLRRFDVTRQRSWRPFQLAFVLLCLPGLTDPSHPDAHRDEVGEAQLLFFPTGGGKTEAYLGLTAYTLGLRRLQGVVGKGLDARDGTDGVSVLMRYTLRLLTAQQFQRATALICACEILRRERVSAGDSRWGSTPFRIGLWVGSAVTPNSFSEARRAIEDTKGQDDAVGGPLQLASCPWCGSRLSAGRDLLAHEKRRRVLLFCSDPEGDCAYSPRNSPDEGLPVLVTDEEIYRLTPSLVIGTVDKFAQLPWRASTASLFGTVNQRCPRHGYISPDNDKCTGRHPKAGPLPSTTAQPVMALRPPDLIIQDELHLIADALGSMVGLYETVIDALCTRTENGKPIRPVLVASTATVRRARDQVEQVFARDLSIFPPQVLDAGETFFSTVVSPSPATPSRRYRGICATGERFKAIEIRVAAALLEHSQRLFDKYGDAADPYMTLVDYFTSTRELAGMRRLVEDDIADRLTSQSVGTRRRRPLVTELTSRMPSSRIATTLADLERPFSTRFDTNAAMDVLRGGPGAEKEQLSEAIRNRGVPAIDVLLATSMLQVGVDVQRLGLMLVTGQPKSTAEYIQATSRVGRNTGRPGLVVTLYQWSRPRDLAHYETFGYDHATFGMRVEGLTTTPYSDRALDRGLTAVLTAALRHSGTAWLANTAAASVPVTGPMAKRVVDMFTARAERVTHDSAQAALVSDLVQSRLDKWHHQRTHLPTGTLGYQQAADVTGLLHKPDESAWDTWTAPMSLREVEPEVLLQLDGRDNSLDDAPAWTYDRTMKDSQ